jgi:hypothetical protein
MRPTVFELDRGVGFDTADATIHAAMQLPRAVPVLRPMMARTWILRLGAAVGVMLSIAHAAEPRVRVDIAPPVVARHTFDLAHPPAEMPTLTPPEVGTCVFKFDCGMETQAAGSRWRAPAVTDVVIRAHLTITIWTPIGGPQKVVTHEEGHRRICEIYYRPAGDIAERIGWAAIGSPLRNGTQQQLKQQLDALQRRSIAEFLRETATRCEYAQERFDAITSHSMNPVAESVAMAQALLDERAHYAAVSRQSRSGTAETARARPTRPSAWRAAE